MDWQTFHSFLMVIQRGISFVGILVILSGVILALIQYIGFFFFSHRLKHAPTINKIRLKLGQTLILGLEFIVAADLIGSTTTPDYYSVGILAIIVIIRTVLSISLNRELMSLQKEDK